MSWRAHLPNGRTRLLGIVGHPLAHSLSPEVHTAVLRRLERNLLYVPFEVSPDRLSSFLRRAGEWGIRGLNVTTPYKDRAFSVAHPVDDETRRTRMVNTLSYGPVDGAIQEGGGPHGEGTDGRGILAWLGSLGLSGTPLVVLGFGATARSLVHRALQDDWTVAAIVSRQPEGARSALRAWRRDAARADRSPLPSATPAVHGWNEIVRIGAAVRVREDLARPVVVISTLPPDATVPVRLVRALGSESVWIDMNYGPRARLAPKLSREGRWHADGLGPLLHQAAASLARWLDRPVEVRLFREAAGVPQRRLELQRPRSEG